MKFHTNNFCYYTFPGKQVEFENLKKVMMESKGRTANNSLGQEEVHLLPLLLCYFVHSHKNIWEKYFAEIEYEYFARTISIHQGLHSLPFWTWLSLTGEVTILILHCHSGPGSSPTGKVTILIHQGLHSLPFWTWLYSDWWSDHLDPSRVTFTAILDLAQSDWWCDHLDPSRVTFTAILDLSQSDWWSDHLDPSRVTFTAFLDLALSVWLVKWPSWSIKGCIHCLSGLGSSLVRLVKWPSWFIKVYIHCHSRLGSSPTGEVTILIHQELHSLPFWTWLSPTGEVTILIHQGLHSLPFWTWLESSPTGELTILIHQELHSLPF
jgi:hypothetical protein